ncbi:multiple epidermal growth factor-like domains protein 6 [Sycon ciliatum]|uniref:multiple epidermal growth factor-like domains protein 6 n=1 Tax=Sycon ciliatum TaxID=27933 RepID=UPI0031F6C823
MQRTVQAWLLVLCLGYVPTLVLGQNCSQARTLCECVAEDQECTWCPTSRVSWLMAGCVSKQEAYSLGFHNCTREVTSPIQSAPQCSSRGDYECGLCECPAAYRGRHCQCNASLIDPSSARRECRPSSDVTFSTPACSGQGLCAVTDTGCQLACVSCTPGWHGRFCQCADSLCRAADNGLPCGGHRQGRCCCDSGTCGDCRCLCFPAYNLDTTCNLCDTSLDSCRTSPEKPICSNNGYCLCGKCQCQAGWTGPTCSFCLPGAICSQGQCFLAAACIFAPLECRGSDSCYLCMGENTVSSYYKGGKTCIRHFCPANITFLLLDTPPETYTFDDPSNPPSFRTEGTLCITQNVQFFVASSNNRFIGIAVVFAFKGSAAPTDLRDPPLVIALVCMALPLLQLI